VIIKRDREYSWITKYFFEIFRATSTASRPRSLFYKIDFVYRRNRRMQRSALLCSLFIYVHWNDRASRSLRRVVVIVPGCRRWFVYATGKFATLESFYYYVLRPTVRWWCTYFVSAVSRRRLIACLICRALFFTSSERSIENLCSWYVTDFARRYPSFPPIPITQLNCVKFFTLKRINFTTASFNWWYF